jgi:uncharacterized protein (TIGR01777 family)
MRILITGGTGFIGTYLRKHLLQRGYLVTIVSRNPEKYESETAQNQQFVSWKGDLVGEMEKADAVINLAGESIFGQRWTEETKQRIYSSRIDSTRQIVNAIRKANNPPSVLLSASAAGYYGDRGNEVIDETTEAGNDFLARVCIDWEAAAEKVTETGVRLAKPRIGIALEKGGGALQQMLLPFKLFVGGSIGNGEQYFPWIHMLDLCRGITFALENEKLNGAFNLNAPNPVMMDEFAKELGKQLGRPSIMKVPDFLLKLVLGEAAKPITNSLRLKPEKLEKLGFEFRFNHLEIALGDIL